MLMHPGGCRVCMCVCMCVCMYVCMYVCMPLIRLHSTLAGLSPLAERDSPRSETRECAVGRQSSCLSLRLRYLESTLYMYTHFSYMHIYMHTYIHACIHPQVYNEEPSVDLTTNVGTAAYMAPELSNLKKFTSDFSRDDADLELVRNRWVMHTHTYTRTHTHTYIHTCIHAYIHISSRPVITKVHLPSSRSTHQQYSHLWIKQEV